LERKKKESSEKMDETWAPQNKDEEQQIMWLNKLPPGVKIPLTAEQMAKVAKMDADGNNVRQKHHEQTGKHNYVSATSSQNSSATPAGKYMQRSSSSYEEVYSNQAGMKQHAGPSSKYGIPDKQNNWKTQKQPIPAKISKEMKFATANTNSSDSTTSNTKETYEAYTCTETSGNKIIDHQETRGMGSTDEETSASKETNQKEAYSSSQKHSTGQSNSSSEEQATKQETKEELKDDDPEINPDPPTKMEEEMDKMFNTDDYPAVEEIISAAIPKEVGVNNHGSTVLFAVALLKDQKTDTFIWVLETFVQAMGGKEPKTIITDQDKAMKKAIQTVLKTTTHRNCYFNTVEPGTTRAAAGPFPQSDRKASPVRAVRCKGVPPDLYLVRKVWMMPRLVSGRAHTYTLNTSLDRLSGCPVNRLMEPIHHDSSEVAEYMVVLLDHDKAYEIHDDLGFSPHNRIILLTIGPRAHAR
ncbi:hypothetical protein QYE76_071937, partial [Lolium multiflorum]